MKIMNIIFLLLILCIFIVFASFNNGESQIIDDKSQAMLLKALVQIKNNFIIYVKNIYNSLIKFLNF
jgi:succinate dehydrogenase hydrophobic anchor subunit